MTITSFVLQVALLLLPGVLASTVYCKLKGRDKPEKWQHLREIVIFSLAAYAAYAVGLQILATIGCTCGKMTFFDEIQHDRPDIAWKEVLIASLIGLPLAFAACYVHTHKAINRIGRLLRVTKSFGDEDVWDFFHNMDMEEEWIFVRDHKRNLLYFGWVLAYSASARERELVLRDVDVYDNDTALRLYSSDVLYVCSDKHDLTLEVPTVSENSHGTNSEPQEVPGGGTDT